MEREPLELDVLVVIFANLSIKEKFVMRRVSRLWREAAEIVLKKQTVVCTQTFVRSYFFYMNFCGDPKHFASRKCMIPNNAIRTKKQRRILVTIMSGIRSIRVAYDPLSKSFLNFLLSHPSCQIECISCCEMVAAIQPGILKHFRIFSRGKLHGITMVNSLLNDAPLLEVMDIEKCRVLDTKSGHSLSFGDLHAGLKTIRLPDCDDFFSVLFSPAVETIQELELSTRDADIIKSRINEIRPAAHLQKLKLEHKALSDDGHSIIINFLLLCNPHLKELSLSLQPNLRETHVGYVNVFTHFRHLKDIDLNLWRYDPHYTEEVIEVICENHPYVECITLKSRSLLESTLMKFADLKNLRRLYIRTGQNFMEDTISQFYELRQMSTNVPLDFNVY